jgi:peroxiredoxin
MKYMESAGQRQNVVPQTYIIDKNGKIVETILGARSKKDFLNLINKYL